ncbi:hypothetical protein KKG77_00675 [bacterium]|nr:hypothetical protein [bacterium]
MQNPFESGHIKNYILLYVSVVVIMILFFVASTLLHDVPNIEQKIFDTNISEDSFHNKKDELKIETNSTKFKLLDKAY